MFENCQIQFSLHERGLKTTGGAHELVFLVTQKEKSTRKKPTLLSFRMQKEKMLDWS